MNPIKRKIIQIAAFGISNVYFPNFFRGTIYKGELKRLCVPGLNCYSCPGAIASCPIGALQAVSGSAQYSFSFYAMGLILAFGVFMGRFVCGFLCPFGLFQELIYKIPTPKFKLYHILKYVKYVVLVVFVFILPLTLTNFMGVGKPAFCQYICPAGTLEGGVFLLIKNPNLRAAIGSLFFLKLAILILNVIGSIFIFRFFCKLLCPLGAIYGLMNQFSFYHITVNERACIQCGACHRKCEMDVNPVRTPNSPECIRCGDCIRICPKNALSLKFQFRYNGNLKETKNSCHSCDKCKPG